MIDNQLLASRGQVKIKTLTGEAYGWLCELPYAQKGKPFGEMMTDIYMRMTEQDKKIETLERRDAEKSDVITAQGELIQALKNEVNNLKGIKVDV